MTFDPGNLPFLEVNLHNVIGLVPDHFVHEPDKLLSCYGRFLVHPIFLPQSLECCK